ncbi:hypothetical protein U27_05226 [Candidatus Vecturithrix granuli]|uniref:HSP-70 cofactor n=1 Tax=Vecturithrix granuli TaxID=1499967 RepID=A0A081C0Z8_VECG1|nr:hypothetical protein U27_05226 [Candidatus Vecturithrix granuli]
MTTSEAQVSVQEEPKVLEEQPTADLQPEFDLDELIASARKSEEAQFEDDRQQYDANLEEARYWEKHGKTLLSEIERAADAAKQIIVENREIVAAFPDELQQEIKNHQEGLEIIGRMLERLVTPGDRLKKLASDLELSGDLQMHTEQEWQALIEEITEKELALKKIQQELNSIGKDNYKVVSLSNDLVKNRKNQILSFLEKQVLPILDGIYDGQKHLPPRIEEFRHRYAENAADLDAWCAAYNKIGEELEHVFEQLEVHEMDVVPGAVIDFERHEPCAVEPDPSMENDRIKEITRKGYEYVTHCGERLVLRAAQVVVVKNENETQEM